MIFRVPKGFKGSFTLNTVEKALWAGVSVSIEGSDINAPDVKQAIANGALVPLKAEKKKYNEISKDTFEARIINKTGRTLILDGVRISVEGAFHVNKKIAYSGEMLAAQSRGLIEITSEEVIPQTKKKKKAKKEENVEAVEEVEVGIEEVEEEEEELELDIDEESNEDKTEEDYMWEADRKEKERDTDAVSVVWDPNKKKNVPAKKVPKTPDPFKVGEEEEEEIPEKTVKKISKKKKAAKKKTKKAVAKKTKKKGNIKKKKKVKPIVPMGEVKPEKKAFEADQHFDERGRTVQKASDELQHLIDAIESDEDNNISFVDKEQNIERVQKRMDNN